MKLFLFALAASSLVNAIPHGPDEEPMGAPAPKQIPKIIPSTNVTVPAAVPKISTSTPAGCYRLATDTEWPSPAEWIAALPRVIPRASNLAPGVVRPDYHLGAKDIGEVQAAVKFCAKNKIRLTVINSGHDFLGRNNAVSGLSLDVSKLTGVKVLESFTPTTAGAEAPEKKTNVIVPVLGKQAAVTFGVGVPTQRLNNAIHASKLLTMGAAHGTVSVAGGWGQTAGHGPLTAQYGLGVDQFLEFKVVTADGELRIANKVSNPDLFWALRGGGASTFGIVVEATVKAYPDIPITVTNWWINSTAPNHDGLWSAYTYLHTQFPSMVQHGISGYYYIYPTAIKGVFLHPANISGTTNAHNFWSPYLEKMASYPTMQKAVVKYFERPDFKSYFDNHFGAIDIPASSSCPSTMPGMAGMKRHGPGSEDKDPIPQPISPLDSRLLGAAHFSHPSFKAALKATSPASGGILQGHLVSSALSSPSDNETSVLPAWRKANVHLIGFKSGNISIDSIRAISADSGAYANEAFPLEQNFANEFWGANYPRLSALKKFYDPNLVFWTSPGINADAMRVGDGGRVCAVAVPVVDGKGQAPKIDNPTAPVPRDWASKENNGDKLSAFPVAGGGVKKAGCAVASAY